MNRIELVLKSLEGNAKDFAECCNTKVCDPNLVVRLDSGLAQGHKLIRGIKEIMDHLAAIKEKLEETP